MPFAPATIPCHSRSFLTSLPTLLVPPVVFTGLLLALWTYKVFMTVVFQEKILYMSYMPPQTRSERIEDYAATCKPVQWEEVRIKSLDGTKIALGVGSIHPQPASKTPTREVVICYFQGNGGSCKLEEVVHIAWCFYVSALSAELIYQSRWSVLRAALGAVHLLARSHKQVTDILRCEESISPTGQCRQDCLCCQIHLSSSNPVWASTSASPWSRSRIVATGHLLVAQQSPASNSMHKLLFSGSKITTPMQALYFGAKV